MEYALIGIAVFATCISCVLFIAWRRMSIVFSRMSRHTVSAEDMTREDLQIIREQPLNITIGDRQLVVDEGSISEYEIFLTNFKRLVLMYKEEAFFYDFLELASLSDSEELKRKASEIERAAGRIAILKEIERIIYKVLLKKNKMSIRYFRKHASRVDVLRIFYAIKCYSMDAVKKNILYLLQNMGAISASAVSSSVSQMPTAGMSKSPVKEVYPWYSSSFDEEPNPPPQEIEQ